MDKSKLKVFDVPFTTTVTGTIKALATTKEEAAEFLNKKLEDGSLGWDESNLVEEGILHDGSITFGDIKPGEIEGNADQITESSDDPKEHGDWDAFEDDSDEEE